MSESEGARMSVISSNVRNFLNLGDVGSEISQNIFSNSSTFLWVRAIVNFNSRSANKINPKTHIHYIPSAVAIFFHPNGKDPCLGSSSIFTNVVANANCRHNPTMTNSFITSSFVNKIKSNSQIFTGKNADRKLHLIFLPPSKISQRQLEKTQHIHQSRFYLQTASSQS